MIISHILTLLGLIFSPLLFFKFPIIINGRQKPKPIKISVIIPARNEENNLALLLEDLKNQKEPAFEIICIDDGSTDRTAEIINEFNVDLISVIEKPPQWLGKSWACQKGAEAAKGELLLFLDADVRLGSDALKRLTEAYFAEGCTVSVAPYHKTKKRYEQFSMFFNLVQYAANGLGKPNMRNIGLYGPVILISRGDYFSVGGHERIKSSVIDDIALGKAMKEKKIPFRLFLGDSDIYYRMYSGGLLDLFRGWMKNIASGAVSTPFSNLLMVFLWITSCISVPLLMTILTVKGDSVFVCVYALLYFVWILELNRIAKRIGSFDLLTVVLFPIPLMFFVFVCLLSSFKKILKIKTVWKGRKV